MTASFILWALVHSLLADHRIKARFRAHFGDRAYRGYRLAYNLFACLSFAGVLAIYWHTPDHILWTTPRPWHWVLRGGQLAGLIGLIVAVFHTDVGAYAGLAQLHPAWTPEHREPMRIAGLYCLVRHPIYFFSLPLIWLNPTLTRNNLILAALFTLYFYLGAKHEETGLRQEFGPAYDTYRQHVPMLIPRPQTCTHLRQTIQPNSEHLPNDYR